MRNNQPVTQREYAFPDQQRLISTTDLKGQITYCNDIFAEVSGFARDELIRAPHNLVRHPDVPPAVFDHMWTTLKQGKPWMGIVKNRCKNGDHYWVSAFVTPISRNGRVVEYQSVRTKPAPAQIAAAEQLYAQLRNKRPPPALRRAPLSARSRVALLAALGAAPCVVGALLAGAGLIAALATAAAAVLGAGAMAYVSLTPLQRLAEQARRVGDNPVGQLVYAGRRDEFGQIAFAMKMLETEAGAMVGRIADCSRQLSSHARDLLGAMHGSTESASRQQQETDLIATAIRRGGQIIGGSCAYLGICGSATGVGVAFSLILQANPVKAAERQMVQQITTRVLEKIAAFEAARCCQRDCWLGLKTAAELSHTYLSVPLQADAVIGCYQRHLNRECIGMKCPVLREVAAVRKVG